MTAAKRTPKTEPVKEEPKGPGMETVDEGVAAAEDMEITKERKAPEIDEETRKENIRRMYEE